MSVAKSGWQAHSTRRGRRLSYIARTGRSVGIHDHPPWSNQDPTRVRLIRSQSERRRSPGLAARRRRLGVLSKSGSFQHLEDLTDVVHSHQVSLPADFVQHRTGYGLVLETGVVRGDVEVRVSPPQMHGDTDLPELEASVGGKELEILCGPIAVVREERAASSSNRARTSGRRKIAASASGISLTMSSIARLGHRRATTT